MLKLDGTFPIMMIAPAQGVRRAMKDASQQVRQLIITPPVAIFWGDRWRNTNFTFKRLGSMAVAIMMATPPALPTPVARGIAHIRFRRFRGLNFALAPDPSCRLG